MYNCTHLCQAILLLLATRSASFCRRCCIRAVQVPYYNLSPNSFAFAHAGEQPLFLALLYLNWTDFLSLGCRHGKNHLGPFFGTSSTKLSLAFSVCVLFAGRFGPRKWVGFILPVVLAFSIWFRSPSGFFHIVPCLTCCANLECHVFCGFIVPEHVPEIF